MMSSDYPDAEIDKVLETFSMSGQLAGTNKILNGEYIDNDNNKGDLNIVVVNQNPF